MEQTTKEPAKDETAKEKKGENMTDQAKELRRLYKREWNRNNRDKVRESQRRYWDRKAAEAARDQDAGTHKTQEGKEQHNHDT